MIYKRDNIDRRVGVRGGHGELEMAEILKGDIFTKVSLLGVLTLFPQSSIGLHEHEEDGELYHVLEGKGIFNDNGVEKEVVAGDFCIITKNQKHGITNTSTEQDMKLLVCVFKDYISNQNERA